MEKFQLPETMMRDLKCNLCSEYLSYAPITLHADTGSVCGRCPALEAERNIIPLRESNYEKIAKNLFLFPCRYNLQGCEGIFTMDDIPGHESVCMLKPFFCPAMPLGSCAWQGSASESHHHFLTDHQDLFLQSNVFELDLLNNYSINMLMVQYDTLFLLHMQNNDDNSMFFCGIYQINNCDSKKYDYLLEFKSGDAQKKFQVGEKRVPIFKNDISKDDGLKINVPIIRETLNSPMIITCTVEISEGIMEILEQEIDTVNDIFEEMDDELQEIMKVEDDKMLIDIECPVCQEFMVPPIYQCQTGHSVCGICKPQLKECPSCRGVLGETRNFTLEKITEHIMYQCRNRLDGCSHRSNSKNIRKHELECKFSPTKCPLHEYLECTWKGLNKAIISHMKIDHINLLIFEPFSIKLNYCDEETQDVQKVTKIFGEIFRLRVGYNNEKKKFYASVQFVGSKEDSRNYMYEVQLVDLKTKCMQILVKRFCGSIHDKKNDISYCTVLPLDMALLYMSNENKFEVKFKIMKV